MIAAYVKHLRSKWPDKRLFEIVDALQVEDDGFLGWHRGMRAKLISSNDRALTTDSKVLTQLFGKKDDSSYPDERRSVLPQHSTFVVDLLAFSPRSEHAERLGDDKGIEAHMVTLAEDQNLNPLRPLQVYFRDLSRDTICVFPGCLSILRGGKRIKAVWLLAKLLKDANVHEGDVSKTFVRNSAWLFQNLAANNVGRQSPDQRRNAMLAECADDQAFTKMMAVEAFFTVILPVARSARKDGAGPDEEELDSAWKNIVKDKPKVGRAICNARDMSEFIRRVAPAVKRACGKCFCGMSIPQS